MVQELQVNEPQIVPEPSLAVEERVEHEKTRRRRRWVLYTLLQLIFVSILIGLLVIWQRDTNVVKARLAKLTQSVETLQASVDKWEFLPVIVPGMGDKFVYADNATRHYAVKTDQSVIIAFTSRVDRKLRQDGRAVIMYENRKEGPRIYAQWMPTDEFRKAYFAQEESIKQFQAKRFGHITD
jgi:hypothetical protein